MLRAMVDVRHTSAARCRDAPPLAPPRRAAAINSGQVRRRSGQVRRRSTQVRSGAGQVRSRGNADPTMFRTRLIRAALALGRRRCTLSAVALCLAVRPLTRDNEEANGILLIAAKEAFFARRLLLTRLLLVRALRERVSISALSQMGDLEWECGTQEAARSRHQEAAEAFARSARRFEELASLANTSGETEWESLAQRCAARARARLKVRGQGAAAS